MSIHLVGGGWSPLGTYGVYDEFLVETTERGRRAGREEPRIGVLMVVESPDDADEHATLYRAALLDVGPCEPVIDQILETETFSTDVLENLDGLVVAGGLTPAYATAIAPLVDGIRRLVEAGLPYLGFSAGAALASETAILGGWQIDDIAVCPEEAAEELDEVTVGAGIGLVDLSIEAHAAQWGTLTRLIAATEAGLVDGGVAIDEFTALIVSDDSFRVVGIGNVWRVIASDDGVLVSTLVE